MQKQESSNPTSKSSTQSKHNGIPELIPNPDGPPVKRGYQESPPACIDKQGMPMVAPNDDPDDSDPDPSSSKSISSKNSSVSRKKPNPFEMVDDDVTMDETVDQRSTRSTRAAKTKAEKEEEAEQRLRYKPYTQRPKFDNSLKWNGTSATFRAFSKALEGLLIMGGGGGYINEKIKNDLRESRKKAT